MLDAKNKAVGCLLGAATGDIMGAPVEAESAGYIRKTFESIDSIIAMETFEELLGEPWQIGRYTDDTQMMLALAQWLVQGCPNQGRGLLRSLVQNHDSSRRYGPGTERIFRAFVHNPSQWQHIATGHYQGGSFGNGAAVRVAPVGVRYAHQFKRLIQTAQSTASVTHTHPLAVQGTTIMAMAISNAMRMTVEDFDPARFLALLYHALAQTPVPLGTDDIFEHQLNTIEQGLMDNASPMDIAPVLGTGIEVHYSVPYAIYCALYHHDSYEDAITSAIFAGGDTDSIACMTGAIVGALGGLSVIPSRWLKVYQDNDYSIEDIHNIATQLLTTSLG